MKQVPLFKNPELQNALSYLSKLTKDELSFVQFIIQGLIDKKPKFTPKEVAKINVKRITGEQL
jgi:hypothetical protein